MDEFRTDLSLVKEKELALATSLIEALAGEFEPDKYKDDYRENLLQMIEAKKQGQEVVATPEPQREGGGHYGSAEGQPGGEEAGGGGDIGESERRRG